MALQRIELEAKIRYTKLTILVVFFLLGIYFPSFTYSQDLKNTTWIKVRAERKDGSKIVDRLWPENGSISYHFSADSATRSLNNRPPVSMKYALDNTVLSIGNYDKYTIDSLNEMFLGITEIPKQNLPEDKFNSFVFVRLDHLFDYYNQAGQLTILEDSLIQCNKQFSPVFKGNMESLFVPKFKDATGKRSLQGFLVLSPEGNVQKIQIEPSGTFSEEEIKKIKNIIDTTSGSWDMPAIPKHLQFKVDFFITINRYSMDGYPSFLAINFFFHENDWQPGKALALEEVAAVNNYFNNGVRLFNKGKFDKAINEFLKCIEIDPKYTDAYYNIAAAYLKLGNTVQACEFWKKLQEMGQKGGERLYKEHCR